MYVLILSAIDVQFYHVLDVLFIWSILWTFHQTIGHHSHVFQCVFLHAWMVLC